MAGAEPKRRISMEQAIMERIGQFSGALGSALRARAKPDLDPVMSDIDRLLQEACILERLAFTKNVLKARAAPRVLIERLLTDNYLIARTMHDAGYGLSDDRLIEMLMIGGQDFQLDVATRAGISERITDYLVEACGDEVTYRVAANKRATLSRSTMSWLLQRAAVDPKLREALIVRIDPKTSAGARLIAELEAHAATTPQPALTEIVFPHTAPRPSPTPPDVAPDADDATEEAGSTHGRKAGGLGTMAAPRQKGLTEKIQLAPSRHAKLVKYR